ncbi:MAG: hypothetical protein NZM12_14360, partial [Steroidobacteraceae bacterium]|nr:hypothetical protein [Steroidobacteraceae bacterium]
AAHARLLGVRCYAADAPSDLVQIAERVRHLPLAIVDTAALDGPQDAPLRMLAAISSNDKAWASLLIASADTLANRLRRLLTPESTPQFAGLAITKVDQADEFAALLSVAIEHRLPVSFTTHGRRVLEDLRIAEPFELVAAAFAGDASVDNRPDRTLEQVNYAM